MTVDLQGTARAKLAKTGENKCLEPKRDNGEQGAPSMPGEGRKGQVYIGHA